MSVTRMTSLPVRYVVLGIILAQAVLIGWLLNEKAQLRGLSRSSLPLLGPEVSSPLVHCFFHGKTFNLKCTRSEKLVKTDEILVNGKNLIDLPVWATVIGIGPPKSGSTELIGLLETHPNVSVGRNSQGSAELTFFNNNPGQGGFRRYQSYFQRSKSSLHYAEKTPAYSYNTEAPYLMRAFLHRKVKLIYTIRDSTEEDASWYMHRRKQERPESLSYSNWTNKRFLAWRDEVSCREKAFHDIMLPPLTRKAQQIKLDDIFNDSYFDWQTSYQVEMSIQAVCSRQLRAAKGKYNSRIYSGYLAEQKHTVPSTYDDSSGSLVEFDHYNNLRRWVHVFGKENILCVWDRDLHSLTARAYTLNRLAKFLDINPEGWPNNNLSISLTRPSSTLRRKYSSPTWSNLYTDQMTNFNHSKQSVQLASEVIRKSFSNSLTSQKYEWLRSVCNDNDGDKKFA